MKNLNGEWAPGEGIFETIRVEDGQVFALHRHHCRAKEAAEKFGFEIPSEEEVALLTKEVIAATPIKLARLRWQFDKSGELAISYSAYQDPAPAKLMIFDERQKDFQLRNKSYPYKNLELLEIAKSRGFDDGLMIAPDGQFTESSMASVLFKINGEWVTPPLSAGILNGVVRALVIEAGLAKVRRIYIYQLAEIDSVLLLSSLRNAQLVKSIDGKNLQLDDEKCAEIHKLMGSYKGL